MEFDFRVCKECKRKRKRILVGKFDPINKKFHDDEGLTWNGSRCGKCHQNKMKELQRVRRCSKIL